MARAVAQFTPGCGVPVRIVLSVKLSVMNSKPPATVPIPTSAARGSPNALTSPIGSPEIAWLIPFRNWLTSYDGREIASAVPISAVGSNVP